MEKNDLFLFFFSLSTSLSFKLETLTKSKMNKLRERKRRRRCRTKKSTKIFFGAMVLNRVRKKINFLSHQRIGIEIS